MITPDLKSRALGSMMGLAVGDSLGAPLEFKYRGDHDILTEMLPGHGLFDREAGQWTDDTSLALCLAESLDEKGRSDPKNQLEKYCSWWYDNHLSCYESTVPDIGSTTKSSLEDFRDQGTLVSKLSDPKFSGNGSIMRLAPIPVFFNYSLHDCVNYSAESSETTHSSPESRSSCAFMGAFIWKALQGITKEELFSEYIGLQGILGLHDSLKNLPTDNLKNISKGAYKTKDEDDILSSGYVVHTLESALWSFYTTDTFEEGMIRAVNLCGDADTIGAVYGQIAGAYYGLEAIPQRWLDALWYPELIEEKTTKLLIDRRGDLEVVYDLIEDSKLCEAADRIFNYVDDNFSEGKFDVVENMIREVDLERMEANTIVSLICITRDGQDHLPYWKELFESARARLTVLHPDRVDAMLAGLEKPFNQGPTPGIDFI